MSSQFPAPSGSNTFERIKRVSAEGHEFWSARDLARVLEYSEFRHFQPVIEKAREACVKSERRVEDHFEQILEMVAIGSGAQRPIEDWKLSRYACYLVIQNADPSKPLVALGQTYFAVQTRRQEMADDEALKEDKMRLLLRAEMKKHNKNLAGVAKQDHAAAKFNLGVCYLYGEGVAKDEVEAYKWISLAAAQGHADAKKALLTVEGQLTSSQIAEGQRLIRAFKPRKPPEEGGFDSR